MQAVAVNSSICSDQPDTEQKQQQQQQQQPQQQQPNAEQHIEQQQQPHTDQKHEQQPTTDKPASMSKESPPTTITLRYQGNNSKKWDGKLILQDKSYLESLGYVNLVPGTVVELPWKKKRGGTEFWSAIVESGTGKFKVVVITNIITFSYNNTYFHRIVIIM